MSAAAAAPRFAFVLYPGPTGAGVPEPSHEALALSRRILSSPVACGKLLAVLRKRCQTRKEAVDVWNRDPVRELADLLARSDSTGLGMLKSPCADCCNRLEWMAFVEHLANGPEDFLRDAPPVRFGPVRLVRGMALRWAPRGGPQGQNAVLLEIPEAVAGRALDSLAPGPPDPPGSATPGAA